MRDLIRIGLRLGMILILLGGCVHNIYHFQKLTEKSMRYDPYKYKYKSPYNGYGYTSQTRDESIDELEQEEEVIDSLDEAYNDGVSPSSYSY